MILITILVLELRVPEEPTTEALRPLLPVFLTYVLSFVILGIYWNNHHHMLHAADRINGKILWANQHLLFWLSLIPFVTGWMGQNHFAALPTAVYGAVLLMAAIAWKILQALLVAEQGPDSRLARAMGSDAKGDLSMLSYAAAIRWPSSTMDFRCDLRGRGDVVAHPRPSHRVEDAPALTTGAPRTPSRPLRCACAADSARAAADTWCMGCRRTADSAPG